MRDDADKRSIVAINEGLSALTSENRELARMKAETALFAGVQRIAYQDAIDIIRGACSDVLHS